MKGLISGSIVSYNLLSSLYLKVDVEVRLYFSLDLMDVVPDSDTWNLRRGDLLYPHSH